MALFTKDSIDRVRDAVDMVDLVGAKTDLRRVGHALDRALPVPRRAHAVVLGQPRGEALLLLRLPGGGDAFGFVQETEGLDFREAVEMLAERYSVRARARGRGPARRRSAGGSASGCSKLLDRTARFYARTSGSSEEAAKAREYLAERGLAEEVLQRVPGRLLAERLGPGPGGAQRDGYSAQELVDAGLAPAQAQSGGLYDRFRGRIMFPLADPRGRVLGFGARAMGEGRGPKYLNTSESSIYRKGRQLFGIDVARAHADEDRSDRGGRGLHGRAGDASGRDPRDRGDHGHGADRGAGGGAGKVAPSAVYPRARRRPGGAGGDAARRAAGSDRDLELAAVEMPEGADPAEVLQKGEPRR